MTLSKKKKAFLRDVIFIIIGIGSLAIFRADYVAIGGYLFTIIYALSTKDRDWRNAIVLSAALGVIWSVINYVNYDYEYPLRVGVVSFFPALAWSMGLAWAYKLIRHMERLTRKRVSHIISFSILFITLLIFVETLAFHILGVRDIQTSHFPGLPLCDCIHGPRWMQVAYLLMGPVFITIHEYFRRRKQNLTD